MSLEMKQAIETSKLTIILQNQQLAKVKGGSKATSATTSRAQSVQSNSPAPPTKSKAKSKKK
jgi:hypothetical protein